jgi:hypothetical protein
MRSWGEQMARLRVARATGHIPADLATWVLTVMSAAAPDTDRRQERNQLLREAAEHIPGSMWARAGVLARELDAMARRRDPRGPVLERLSAALTLDPNCPRAQRHLYRILAED